MCLLPLVAVILLLVSFPVDHLLKKFFLILYWHIIDLQCCMSFRCTAKWFSYAYIHIGYYRTLSRAPCAIQYVLVGYQLCT